MRLTTLVILILAAGATGLHFASARESTTKGAEAFRADAIVARPGGGIVLAGITREVVPSGGLHCEGLTDPPGPREVRDFLFFHLDRRGQIESTSRIPQPELDGKCAGRVDMLRRFRDTVVVSARGWNPQAEADWPLLARLLPGGVLDRTFGPQGFFYTWLPASSIIVQRSGAIITNGGLRYRRDGSYDSRFELPWLSSAIAPLGGGFVAAIAGPALKSFTVGGFRSDGTPNRRFGRRGRVEVPIRPATLESLDIVTAPGHGIYVSVGYAASEAATHLSYALFHLNGRGRLDRGFGRRGRISLGPRRKFLEIDHVTVTSAGAILASGGFVADKQREAFIRRYRRNGTIDRSFGRAGMTVLRIGPVSETADYFGSAFTLVGSGAMVLTAHEERFGPTYVWKLSRLGSVVRSFGHRGRLVINTVP